MDPKPQLNSVEEGNFVPRKLSLDKFHPQLEYDHAGENMEFHDKILDKFSPQSESGSSRKDLMLLQKPSLERDHSRLENDHVGESINHYHLELEIDNYINLESKDV